MASRAVTTLLASRHERSHLHRIVVRVGAAAAWVATAIFLVAGVITGDRGLLIEAVGPLLAAALMSIQIIVGREDGGIALFGSAIVVTIWYTLFGDEGTIVPAAVALVLITSLCTLFIGRHRLGICIALAAGMAGIPFLWSLDIDEQIVLGSIMALSFVMTSFILITIQTSTSAVQARYQMLFEESPTAVLEEDWSESLAYVRSEYTGKPERIRQFLLAYPAVVKNAIGKARVVRANEAALQLLEIKKEARFLGYRNPEAMVTEETMEACVSALVCLYEGGTSWEYEVPTRRHSGEVMWLQNRSVDTSTGEPASTIVVALADITHMKARNEAMAELVRAKDEFIANVSHELRTPLTAVIGLTSEMVESEMAPDEREELLQLVTGQAAEMANIVDDLLVAARAEMGTVSVDPQAVDLIDETRATLEGLGIEAEIPVEPIPDVWADPRRVRQILRNLLTNAQRYGGPKRRIVTGALIDQAWIEVRDNGEGIPDEQAARIFEPYFTVKTGVKGSVGLGLAVARQLAELMGGSLQYERSAAETVFRLQLPLVDTRQPILASQAESL